jgi:hypothetical protein
MAPFLFWADLCDAIVRMCVGNIVQSHFSNVAKSEQFQRETARLMPIGWTLAQVVRPRLPDLPIR